MIYQSISIKIQCSAYFSLLYLLSSIQSPSFGSKAPIPHVYYFRSILLSANSLFFFSFSLFLWNSSTRLSFIARAAVCTARLVSLPPLLLPWKFARNPSLLFPSSRKLSFHFPPRWELRYIPFKVTSKNLVEQAGLSRYSLVFFIFSINI